MKTAIFPLLMLLCSPLSNVLAQSSVEFCDDTRKGWRSDGCVTSCNDLTVDGVFPGGDLPDGSVGSCLGQATVSRFKIYRIDVASQANPRSRCTIFNGAITLDTGTAAPEVTLYRGSLTFDRCEDKTTYDVMYLYTDRKEEYAGYTLYPDGSGKIARTTNYCATDNFTGTVEDLSWLDSMALAGGAFQDASLCYARQSDTWSTTFKKAANAPTTENFSSATNQLVEYDRYKSSYLNSLSGPPYDITSATNTDDGYYLEYDDGGFSGILGTKLDTNRNRTIVRVKATNGLLVLGTLDKSRQQLLTISYFAASRNVIDKQFGVRFFFRRNGTTAEFLGTKPSDDGTYIYLEQFKQ